MSIPAVGTFSYGRAIAAIALILVCAVLRQSLEADPVTHMLVQLPALSWAGWLLAGSIPSGWLEERVSRLNENGLPGLLIALFAIAYWMLPRSIDSALTSPVAEFAKFITVPFLIGLPLRWSWDRAHPLVRGVLKSNALSMCGVLAWLYSAAPVRVCNSYLIDDQRRLGIAFLCVAIGLAIIWSVRLFLPPDSHAGGNRVTGFSRNRPA